MAPLKVYVGASSREIDRARFWMTALRGAGIEVTSTWPDTVSATGDANPRDASETQRYGWARTDLDQVDSADVFWMLFPSKADGFGAFVELGHASKARKIVITSGDTRRSIFTALGQEFPTDYDAFAHLVSLLNVKDQISGRQSEDQSTEVSFGDLAEADTSGPATPSDPATSADQSIPSVVAEFSQSCVAVKRQGRR